MQRMQSHTSPSDIEATRNAHQEQLPLEMVLTALAPWLGSQNHPKVLQNAKYDRLILLRHGLALQGVVLDTLLADYLRDAAAKHGLDVMAQREFGFQPTLFSDLVGKKQTFADVPLESASLYCGMDVHLTRRLALLLQSQLEAMGPQLLPLLEQVEQPLEPVLAEMEATGIRIDVPYLSELSSEMGMTLERLEREARDAAGVDFNLASPKQLGELLFDTLGLDRKKSRRTKTGYSTDATVLEKLQQDHPVVPLVLEHRVLSKLKSTYIDALPQLVEAETGRVHTDFNQAVTATGRLSSSNPNLQNIPVRTEYSRRIRKAFPAAGGLDPAQRRLLPDRAAHPHPSLRRRDSSGGVPQWRRRPRPHSTTAAGQRGRQPRRTPTGQDDQLRRDLRDGCPALRQGDRR